MHPVPFRILSGAYFSQVPFMPAIVDTVKVKDIDSSLNVSMKEKGSLHLCLPMQDFFLGIF